MLTQRAVPVAFSVGTDERAAAAEASCHDIITKRVRRIGIYNHVCTARILSNNRTIHETLLISASLTARQRQARTR